MNIGETKIVYLDWQTETKPVCKVELLEFIKNGPQFILEDYWLDSVTQQVLKIPESLTEVWASQRWRCRIVEVFPLGTSTYKEKDIRDFNIRYLYTLGISNSKEPSEEGLNLRNLDDKFLKVDGVEVF